MVTHCLVPLGAALIGVRHTYAVNDLGIRGGNTKLHRVHLSPKVNKQAFAPFEIVHSNVWGPCSVLSLTGFRYFVTFVDDFSRVT